MLVPSTGVCEALSWNEVVERASVRAPVVLASAARTEEVRRGEAVAAMLPNPVVTLGGYAESARLYTAIALPLPIFGQIGLAGDAARARSSEARYQQQSVGLEAGLTALLAWLDVWSARATLRAAEATSERLARLEQATRELVAQGQRPRLDLLSASAELSAARADTEAARHAVLAARIALGARLGRVTDERAGEDGLADARGEPPGADAASALAPAANHARHPAIEALRARERGADADTRLEQRLRIPTPVLQIWGYLLRVSGPPADVFAGLSFELPVLHQRAPLIERAQARAATARAEADALSVQLRADARAAWEQYQGADARVRAQQTEVLPAAETAADLALEAYRAGRVDLAGLLAAEQRRLAARVRADQSVVDRARALVALARAAGRLR